MTNRIGLQASHLLKFLLLSILFTSSAATYVRAEAFSRCSPQTKVTMTRGSAQAGAQIPEPIQKPPTISPLECARPFVYRGETYSADSPQAQDASTLKEFVGTVPEAKSTIEEYQTNRTKSKLSAYTGTVGILLAILSGPISKQFNDASRDSVRTALQVGGLAIAAGGFFYSFTLLRTNEYLLPKAVDQYNQARPQDPIELRFTTGWTF